MASFLWYCWASWYKIPVGNTIILWVSLSVVLSCSNPRKWCWTNISKHLICEDSRCTIFAQIECGWWNKHNISMGMVLLNQCLRYLQYWPNDCIKSVAFEFLTGVTLRMLSSGMWYHALYQKCASVLGKYASLLMVEEDTMDIEALCSLKTSVSFFLYTLCHILENSVLLVLIMLLITLLYQ